VELSTTAIFGDLGGYFFGNVRDMLALCEGMGVAHVYRVGPKNCTQFSLQ